MWAKAHPSSYIQGKTLKLIIKILAKLDEMYPVPADENIEEQVKEDTEDLFFDLDGITIEKVKVEKQ